MVFGRIAADLSEKSKGGRFWPEAGVLTASYGLPRCSEKKLVI